MRGLLRFHFPERLGFSQGLGPGNRRTRTGVVKSDAHGAGQGIKRTAAGLGGHCGKRKRARPIQAAATAQLFSERGPCITRLSDFFQKPEL